MKKKITIWPRRFGYIFCILLGTLLTLMAGCVGFIWTLCGQDKNGKLLIMGINTPTNMIIEALIYLIIGFLSFYFIVFRMYYNDRIIFYENSLIKPKRLVSGKKNNGFKISIDEIIDLNINFVFFAELNLITYTGNNHKLLLTPFSKKQIVNIINLIYKNGSHIDEKKVKDLEHFISHEYFISKGKNKK